MNFLNTHFMISRGEPYNPDPNKGVTITQRPCPPLNEFLPLLKRVGGKYGWDRRPKYLDYPTVEQRLQAEDSRFYDIRKDGELIGYCFVTNPNMGKSIIEIENFGFFPEHTGHNYGDIALPLIFEDLHKDYNHVHLETRSTNHGRVIPFYLTNGMTIMEQEILPEDTVPIPRVA